MSDTFCVLPWIHFYANADGSVIPCCVAHHHDHLGNVRNNTIEEIWNSEEYKQLRKNMLSGIRSSECRACYKSEDIGITSARETANRKFKKFIPMKELTNSDGSLDEVNLKYLDLRWSNICNFKCRSCSHTYSSSWAKEDSRSNVYIFSGGEDNDNLYNQIEPHLLDIEEFYFAGGEPLLTDKHYEILNYLLEHGKTDVRLRYNTNMSVLKYKNQNVIDLWRNFSNIFIGASLDSWGNRAEYIREGTDWNTVLENIKTIKQELPNIRIQIQSVVSVFNIFTITDFYDYLLDKDLIDFNYPDLNVYNIQNPDYYSYAIIPEDLKKLIIKKLKSKTYNNDIDQKINDILISLSSYEYNEMLHNKFKITTEHYDKKRNKSFIEVFPELYSLWS